MSAKQPGGGTQGPDVKVTESKDVVVLDNGIVKLTLNKPQGTLQSVGYGGQSNLLDPTEPKGGRGYYDCNWTLGDRDIFYVFAGSVFKIVRSDENGVEVSFLQNFEGEGEEPPNVPLVVDMRYALLKGNSGFYTYAIYRTPSGSNWSDFSLIQTRVVYKLNLMFQYMVLEDDRQRYMPSKLDRLPDRSKDTLIEEARVLTNPSRASLKGEVDDKYHSCMDNKDCRVHGWVSGEGIGFWIVNASDEFCSGGPNKHNLTSHAGPISLRMFHSGHYAPESIKADFKKGEKWSKVYGPVFVYLNKGQPGDMKAQAQNLYRDAKSQLAAETKSWPPAWPNSTEFLKANQRGSVSGVLRVEDRFIPSGSTPAANAFVGLSRPGEDGAWITESKGYQFWTQADKNGAFTISDVRPGTYDVFAWVPGFIGDFRRAQGSVNVSAGQEVKLAPMSYRPPRHGPTLWEIGFPDRTASGFVPDPAPEFVDRLYLRHPTDSFRQYGLWERYTAAFPKQDLVYDVSKGDWKRDWWFAHFCRMDGKGGWLPTTWEIKFEIAGVVANAVYKLRIVFASHGLAAVQVRVNDANAAKPLDESKVPERDNVIARAGNHGVYNDWSLDIPSAMLRDGKNSIFLTQRVARSPYSGVMYDYIRLEAPPPATAGA